MLEQYCSHSKQCNNNVVTLCYAKNRRCESSRVTTLLDQQGFKNHSCNSFQSFSGSSIRAFFYICCVILTFFSYSEHVSLNLWLLPVCEFWYINSQHMRSLIMNWPSFPTIWRRMVIVSIRDLMFSGKLSKSTESPENNNGGPKSNLPDLSSSSSLSLDSLSLTFSTSMSPSKAECLPTTRVKKEVKIILSQTRYKGYASLLRSCLTESSRAVPTNSLLLHS